MIKLLQIIRVFSQHYICYFYMFGGYLYIFPIKYIYNGNALIFLIIFM